MLKIAIVNDSLMAAEALRRVIQDVPEYSLVWVAHNGQEALESCSRNRPDILLMDLIMPVMDGIEATRRISAEHGCAILIVTATVNGHAGRVFEAMGAGALDAVNTPILGDTGQGEGNNVLINKINAIGTLLRGAPFRRGHVQPDISLRNNSDGVPLVAIGASTGGPAALKDVLHALPRNPGFAIAVVQHVDEQFMKSFIDWLNASVAIAVRQARAGDQPEADSVLVCAREDHLILTAENVFDYTPDPTELVFRPSVDVFFHSLAEHQENQTAGVLLTGMGRDGAVGLGELRRRGWLTIAQDQDTSAVYGMPKAAKELDAAGKILPLDKIGPELLAWAEAITPDGQGKRKSG
ncbi:MAG: chemotaxis-specific protein-glutamate methyltransferase CheB [Thiogranum sp.]|nr:chemotaxis-specific protein-glutamate methyltransferase CheB [Thiogranum sp.]